MPRLVGLGYASKLFRQNPDLHKYKEFSKNGNEVAFGMIGDASTAEGPFFETVNAAAVLQIPVAIAVWDDGYGISVTKDLQIVKASISEALKGFEKKDDTNGILIYKANGWDYAGLCKIFKEGIAICRSEHIPVLFHIDEMVQPTGHSTSGSHERYKTPERLQWEADFDPIKKMKEWILEKNIASELEIERIDADAENEVREARNRAWKHYIGPIEKERREILAIIEGRSCQCKADKFDKVGAYANNLKKIINPIRKDNLSTAKRILRHVCLDCPGRKDLQTNLSQWLETEKKKNVDRYNTTLYNETERSALKVKSVQAMYSDDPEMVNGREIIQMNFDKLFSKLPLLVTFGEDTGGIGGVNQSLEGLQKKYGELRITDTGIREATILGQGIGLALRGMRPIAEIQYLDYLMYALQLLSDDLATTHYRTAGRMVAPLIISTRGHRLEGIWHSGSPMSMLINSVRGVYVCSPRDMTRAAGFYNTLLEGNDPAIVIEPLNGYRLKEKMPDNIGEFRLQLGIPEILNSGTDLTVITYGSTVKVAMEAVKQLESHNISVELIDVQTLVPFDKTKMILESIRKTSRVLFLDEDVPGGTTAYMMQEVLEKQGAWQYLDSAPKTLTAKEHRPAYTTDGDYFSKPSAEDIFDVIYGMMKESKPEKY